MEERFERFTVLISNINRCIYKIKTEEMAEFDLKSSHVSCLYYLYKEESLTAKELCDICEEDKANISRSIKHLEENGYIICRAKHQKRYQSPLELTDLGRETGERIAKKIDNILNKTNVGLSNEAITEFYNSLSLINSNLQKICDKYDADNTEE